MTCAVLIPAYGNCSLSSSDNLAPSELPCHDMSDRTNQLNSLATRNGTNRRGGGGREQQRVRSGGENGGDVSAVTTSFIPF